MRYNCTLFLNQQTGRASSSSSQSAIATIGMPGGTIEKPSERRPARWGFFSPIRGVHREQHEIRDIRSHCPWVRRVCTVCGNSPHGDRDDAAAFALFYDGVAVVT
jgi:hypothetical protein